MFLKSVLFKGRQPKTENILGFFIFLIRINRKAMTKEREVHSPGNEPMNY